MPNSIFGPTEFRMCLREIIMHNELKVKSVSQMRNQSCRYKSFGHLHIDGN